MIAENDSQKHLDLLVVMAGKDTMVIQIMGEIQSRHTVCLRHKGRRCRGNITEIEPGSR